MELVYAPGSSNQNAFSELLTARNLNAFYSAYPFDVRRSPMIVHSFSTPCRRAICGTTSFTPPISAPITKSIRPFHFSSDSSRSAYLATAVMLSLPPLVLGHRLPAGKGVMPALLFFMFIGAGYILIQVALIQKFVLFLGHPTDALTVIIFSMLIASGLGSFASRKLVRANIVRLGRVLALIALAIFVMAAVITPIVESGVALPFPVKVLLSVSLIAPVGFAMGMPFPTGLTLLERVMPASVRWAWAINAASSVMGSAAAMFFAYLLGAKAYVDHRRRSNWLPGGAPADPHYNSQAGNRGGDAQPRGRADSSWYNSLFQRLPKSTRFPSGSVNHPKRPYSYCSRLGSTEIPADSRLVSTASRSSTWKFSMPVEKLESNQRIG